LNILFLSELFYPHGGGAELATYLYARLANRSGHNVTVITNRFAGESETYHQDNLSIHRIPLFGERGVTKYSLWHRLDVLFSSRFRAFLKSADIVYIPRFWYSTIPLAKSLGKKVVVHLHDYIPICPLTTIHNQTSDTICNCKRYLCTPKCIYIFEKTSKRKLLQILESMILNLSLGRCQGRIIGLSDAVICVSQAHRNLVIRNAPYLEQKIRVINNPLPQNSHLYTPGDDFGYFGGPSRLKGFFVLWRAIKSINNDYHKIVNVHATKLDTATKSLVKSSRISRIYACGKLGNEELHRVHEKIRAVIVPSIWPEPSPYVVAEALIRGKLVIASDIGGIPELLTGSHGCFLFPSDNHQELAKDILHVAALSKEQVMDLGAKNRESTLRRFSNDKIASEFTQLLSAVAHD